MRIIFWAAFTLIAYTYIGYPAWLWVRSRWRPSPVHAAPYLPFISIVLVVRNEAVNLRPKLKSLLELDYPADQAEILIVSDGSTDETNRILLELAKISRLQLVLHQQPRGKASGLNDAIKIARGDVVVFTDARQKIERSAVRFLMENFADPDVGCVSGELILGDPDCGEAGRGMGLYWKIEKMIRELEAASGSVVGATGALYAVRRSLLVPVPAETILDDVFIPMQALRQGKRVVFDLRAQVWDSPDLGVRREFARKVRTLSGNYQLLQLEPWLLSSKNPVRFELISHKLLRLIVPFALCATLVASYFLHQPIYQIAFIGQIVFYSLGIWALVRPKHGPLARVADGAFTFILLNTAAALAFVNFVSSRKAVWVR